VSQEEEIFRKILKERDEAVEARQRVEHENRMLNIALEAALKLLGDKEMREIP
jgi:hypothetical protein